MSIMPEPTNPVDQINDSEPRRLVGPPNEACVIEGDYCTRHGGVHTSDEEREAMRRDDCPDWCIFDHRVDGNDDLILHQGDDHTDSHVFELIDPHHLDIRVSRTDSLSEGRTGQPTVYVRAELELTTWRQAAELARTILDAFDYLDVP